MNRTGLEADTDKSSALEEFAAAAQRRRQERVTRAVIRVIGVLAVVVVALTFAEESNDPVVTLAFYSPCLAVLASAELLRRRDRSRAAAWLVCCMFWLSVAGSIWFFGGLNYEMGSSFVVSILLAGATLGTWPALTFGLASILAASAVAIAQTMDALPPSLAPNSLVNAWISITFTLLVAALLLHLIIQGTRAAWFEAAEAVNQQRATEEKYLRAQKLEPIGRLATGIAHDFNNILNVITGVSALLRDCDPKEREELLSELDLAAARATLMTNQLLALNRRQPIQPRPVELWEVVETLTPLADRMVGDDIQVSLTRAPGPTIVKVDRGQVEQLLLNLAVNARDAMPAGGRFDVRLDHSCEDGVEWVTLVASDTGEGMPADVVGSAFQPFFTTKDNGTGLGLATVKDIVDRHGGRVEVHSKIGDGTTFTVRFPRLGDDVPATTASSRRLASAPAARVLVVEDHSAVRNTMRRLLESWRHDVTTVGNGQEAWSLLEGGARYDLVVSDLSMPVLDGAQLAERMKTLPDRPPILFVSGHATKLPAELESYRPLVAFIPKPVTSEALKRETNRLLSSFASDPMGRAPVVTRPPAS